jgi:hypothetical protein
MEISWTDVGSGGYIFGLNDSDIELNLLHIFDIYIKSTVIFYALA